MSVVLIIGASSGIGYETVKAALSAGHEVRAFSRSAKNISISHPKLVKLNGDARSSADVSAAMQGVDAVIQSLGVKTLTELAFGTTIFPEATRIMVERMQQTGVHRLIMVTGIGAGNSRGRTNFLYDYMLFPLFLQRVYSDKDIAEDIVQKSNLDWTIVRPGLLTNAPAKKRYKVLNDMKDWRGGAISRADVADFMVKSLADPTTYGKTPILVD
jgi:putative NADH-flavin reductase